MTFPDRLSGDPLVEHDSFVGSSVATCGGQSTHSRSLDFVDLHNFVHLSGAPNYKDCRVPLPTSLNMTKWREYLKDYDDKVVCKYLEFGWPVGYDYERFGFPASERRNHAGATQFPEEISAYLHEEILRGAVAGPFSTVPFTRGMALSPLNSVPKRDSDERRVILDLSWPLASSVNAGIDKDIYEGLHYHLSYPTVDQIAELIVQKGRGCLIYKCDLKRAYRQFPVDPRDYPLLGYSWNNAFFFDVVLPVGLRPAALACQRVTSAVVFVCETRGYDLLNYLDDFMGIEPACTAQEAFQYLRFLLRDLGLVESTNKACPPGTRRTCLGVEFDTVQMTISVTADRLRELTQLLDLWLVKDKVTKRQLQSLIGKLSFVCKCVRQSRIFLIRLLDLLGTLRHNHHRATLTAECKKDIRWWAEFLYIYNGVSIINRSPWTLPDAVFSTDACLTGCGGIADNRYFHARFPDWILQTYTAIHQLECLAIVVAVSIWGARWRGQRLRVYCDNEAVVAVLNTGRTKDKLLAHCLRNLCDQRDRVGGRSFV